MKKIKHLDQLNERREALDRKRMELEKLIRNDWTGFKRSFGSPHMGHANVEGDETADTKADRKSLRNEIVSGIAAIIFRKMADRIQTRMYKRSNK